DDLATVEINGKLGSINKSGKLVVPAQFNKESGFAFSNGLARTKLNDKQGAFVNKAGETVFIFETRR
ncbi:MAG: WG repeat-containing protein, partial [Neisseriaceae bacterium]|nr:WG repeat-containing protein [Neisseriaceae bacterium]